MDDTRVGKLHVPENNAGPYSVRLWSYLTADGDLAFTISPTKPEHLHNAELVREVFASSDEEMIRKVSAIIDWHLGRTSPCAETQKEV